VDNLREPIKIVARADKSGRSLLPPTFRNLLTTVQTSVEPTPIKATRYVFTYNNPVEDPDTLEAAFSKFHYRYLVFQEEKGENGTRHYQGYVHFQRQRAFGPVVKAFEGTPWFQRARGSPQQCRDYCTKEDTRQSGPWEFGELPAGQGARTDLVEFRDAVRSGKRYHQLADDFVAILARYPRLYSSLQRVRVPVLRADGIRVELLHGATGIGKTRSVMERHALGTELYTSPLTSGFWFDGYDGHDVVLLDDFSGSASHFTLCNLLRLLDRYPVQVPIKGDFVWWYPRIVYVTTNNHPRLWYKWDRREGQYAALMRRFTTITHEGRLLELMERKRYEEWRPEPPPIPTSSDPFRNRF